VTSSSDQGDKTAPAPLDDAVDALLRFGVAMLRAGNTASRTRERMDMMARRLGFDAVSLSLTLDSITASVHRAGQRATAMLEVGPQGINTWRIGELERLAKSAAPGLAPRDLTARLAEIEATPSRYSQALLAVAIAAASSGFAFVNGAAIVEIVAAGLGGGAGQALRSWLSRRQISAFAVAASCAFVASGVYVLATAAAGQLGFAFARHPAGFISSVLFLVPGFPLIAALFDLLQHQTIAAVTRLAYGLTMLLAVTFGLGIIIAVAGVDMSSQPPPVLAYPLKLSLRAVASFAGGCAFAILFASSPRLILAAGVLAVVANGLRLVLHNMGVMAAPAAFFAALVVGLVAVLADRRLNVPRIALTVPPIIIMVPGVAAFQMLVFFYQGDVIDALHATASCGFVIGALALGLVTARFFSGPVDA